MYEVCFYELTTRGLTDQPNNIVYVNKSFKGSNFKKGKGDISNWIEKCDEIIPASGIISIGDFDEQLKEYGLCYTINYHIPCVKSSLSIISPELTKEIIIQSTRDMNVIQSIQWLETHIDSEEKINMMEYNNLPDEQWIQLNSLDDLFIIQVKLRKINPTHKYKSLSRGEYWVYKIVKLVFYRREGNLGCINNRGISKENIIRIHGKKYIEKANLICSKRIKENNDMLKKIIRDPIHINIE